MPSSSKPPWKSLVEDLKHHEQEDPYRERLARQFDTGADARSLQRELIGEMSSALKRAEDKLAAAISACERAGADALAARDPARRDEALAHYRENRAAALRARWELVIHRESLGFYRHEDVDAHHPIPPERPRR